MKFCSTSWDRIDILVHGVKPIPTGSALIGLDGAAIIAEPCPKCQKSSQLYSELYLGTCRVICDSCKFSGPELKPLPTPEEATPEGVWIAWNNYVRAQHAEAVANRCRELHLHLEHDGRTSDDDWGLARHYEDRLGSRDGNFSHEELMDAKKLLSKHGF